MEKLFICVDNKIPGAIIGQIVKFLLPCSLCRADWTSDNTIAYNRLSTVNKYFKKVLDHRGHCPINDICYLTLCNHWICKHCTSDYRQLKKLEIDLISVTLDLISVTQDRHRGWIHFDSREHANKYEHIVQRYFSIKGRCCGGKGLAIQ